MTSCIKRFCLRAAVLLLALLTVGCAAGSAAQSDAVAGRSKVVLVAKSTQTEFWKAVFVGAQAAATEYNLDLTTIGPDTEEDYETQNAMVRQAVEDGAQALVFSAIDYEANAPAIEEVIRQGIPVVVIDSAVNVSGVATYIGTDNYNAGVMAAQAALDTAEGELRVGVVNYDINSANGQGREQGARDTLTESGRAESVISINTLADADAACADTAALLQVHPELNVLLALNEPTSVGAARAVVQLGLQDAVTVIAFDSNLETIEGLESGSVDALIVQNTYAMGYLGVQSAYKLLAGQGNELEKTVDTETHIINRDNMYTENGQEILFRFED